MKKFKPSNENQFIWGILVNIVNRCKETGKRLDQYISEREV